jgi:hypothetical protein
LEKLFFLFYFFFDYSFQVFDLFSLYYFYMKFRFFSHDFTKIESFNVFFLFEKFSSDSWFSNIDHLEHEDESCNRLRLNEPVFYNQLAMTEDDYERFYLKLFSDSQGELSSEPDEVAEFIAFKERYSWDGSFKLPVNRQGVILDYFMVSNLAKNSRKMVPAQYFSFVPNYDMEVYPLFSCCYFYYSLPF